jgi:IS605 OrfB family transposase
MTCVSTIGDSFIIDGRKLKSYNHYYNKEYARRKSIATVDAIGHRKVESGDRIPTTKAMRRMNRKRDNYMTDYMRKACRMVINYCLDNKVGCIVIGRNKKWKHKVNMHKDDNQNFVYIPYTKLYAQLAFLCEKYGIEYIEVNEAYTSQSSCNGT